AAALGRARGEFPGRPGVPELPRAVPPGVRPGAGRLPRRRRRPGRLAVPGRRGAGGVLRGRGVRAVPAGAPPGAGCGGRVVTGVAARAAEALAAFCVAEALAAFCVAEACELSRRERRPVQVAEAGS